MPHMDFTVLWFKRIYYYVTTRIHQMFSKTIHTSSEKMLWNIANNNNNSQAIDLVVQMTQIKTLHRTHHLHNGPGILLLTISPNRWNKTHANWHSWYRAEFWFCSLVSAPFPFAFHQFLLSSCGGQSGFL